MRKCGAVWWANNLHFPPYLERRTGENVFDFDKIEAGTDFKKVETDHVFIPKPKYPAIELYQPEYPFEFAGMEWIEKA
jgi:hypothetical protein